MTVYYKDVENFLFTILQDRLKLLGISPEEFKGSFPLIPGIIDSVGFLELVSKVEEEFKIEMDFESADPDGYTTLSGFIHCIKGLES